MTPKPIPDCGCTGVRWCARCLDPALRKARKMDDPVPTPDLLLGDEIACDGIRIHAFQLGTGTAPTFPAFRGLHVIEDFISEPEAASLLAEIESVRFLKAQSGKGKQHYGPKINFNKRRMNPAPFKGIPDYAHDLEDRLRDCAEARIVDNEALLPALASFDTTDVFVLRYEPIHASNLDLHVDDTFAYGEVILDLSLESDSVLTFFRGRPGNEVDGILAIDAAPSCVRVPLPARSLAVLHGPARFEWEHGILARDIGARRTSVTMRTLGKSLAATEEGQIVIERARRRGAVVHSPA